MWNFWARSENLLRSSLLQWTLKRCDKHCLTWWILCEISGCCQNISTQTIKSLICWTKSQISSWRALEVLSTLNYCTSQRRPSASLMNLAVCWLVGMKVSGKLAERSKNLAARLDGSSPFKNNFPKSIMQAKFVLTWRRWPTFSRNCNTVSPMLWLNALENQT